MQSINDFLDRYFTKVWRELARSVKKACPWMSWDQVEDVTQKTLIRLLSFDNSCLAELSEEDAKKLIFAYLYRCLRAQLGDEARAYKRRQLAEAIPQWEGKSRRFSPEIVKAALMRLPESSRELLEQIYYDGVSKEEILLELNARSARIVTMRALNARIARALEMLRHLLVQD